MDQLGPIQQYVEDHLSEYVDDLTSLCAIDSGSYDKGGVDQVQAWLARGLSQAGFSVDLKRQQAFGDDLVATRPGDGTRRVMLLGHADTVYPAGTAAARPVTVAGEKILGPGTCDMKAGLLAGLYAVRALDATGWNGLEQLTFVVVSDEEIGERHSIDLLREQGSRHDAVLTLEAARENGDVVTSRKAGCWMTVEAVGKAAHAGVEPEKGASATHAIGRIVDRAFGLNGHRPGMTVNPGEIAGGRAPNVVADYASAHFDLRAWTNAELAELQDAFVKVCYSHGVEGVRVDVTQDAGSGCPAMEKTPGVELLEATAIEIANSIGFELAGAATGGGSDISFAGHAGTPGLDGLGPVGGRDHGPDEYILRESIVPRITLLTRLIQDIGDEEKFTYVDRAG